MLAQQFSRAIRETKILVQIVGHLGDGLYHCGWNDDVSEGFQHKSSESTDQHIMSRINCN